jgi:hypothetical protein
MLQKVIMLQKPLQLPFSRLISKHDLALDDKLACSKRYHNILEEIEYQKTQLPKGLFPEMI